MRGAAHARTEDGAVAAPTWTRARHRRIRRRPPASWPGDVAPDAVPDAVPSSEVFDVPAWIDQRSRPPVGALGLAIAGVSVLDVSFLVLRLALG